MNEAIDYTALNWVRHELNEKLYQARQCLGEYSETPEDVQLLHECMTSLHQARGPLQMVDLPGADRLAAEMEAAINALEEGRVALTEESLEILMQAFIQRLWCCCRLLTVCVSCATRSRCRRVPYLLLT